MANKNIKKKYRKGRSKNEKNFPKNLNSEMNVNHFFK